MIDVVGLIAGAAALVALVWRKRRGKPRLPMSVANETPNAMEQVMTKVADQNLKNCADRMKAGMK